MIASFSAIRMPSTVEALVEELKAAFAEERKRGEALDYVLQSERSFHRLDAAVRGAVQRFVAAPYGGFAAVGPYLNFNDTHYTRNLVAETADFELMVSWACCVGRPRVPQ